MYYLAFINSHIYSRLVNANIEKFNEEGSRSINPLITPIESGSHFDNFFQQTKGMDPTQRAVALEVSIFSLQQANTIGIHSVQNSPPGYCS